jgi:hypothetical protein
MASGSFWIVQPVSAERDFTVTLRVRLPPRNTLLARGGGQAMLAFGVFPQGPGDGLTIPSPPPLPTASRVRLEGQRIRLRRVDGREFSLPLDIFIENDQRVARQLSALDGNSEWLSRVSAGIGTSPTHVRR